MGFPVSLGFLIGMLVMLLIAGFVLWAGRALVAVIPLDPVIHRVIDVVIVIVAVAIVLFYVVIPVLNMLAGLHIPTPR